MFTDDQGQRQETKEEIGIESKLDLILDELKLMRGAFAKKEDGSTDFDGHRQYHEEMIRAAKAQTKFWEDIRLEVAKKGVLFLIITLCGLAVIGFQTKFGLK